MLLTFDFNSSTPIYMQLRNQVVIAIAEGKLNNGDKLPTVRALADESGINSMTVSKAYQLLKHEGYIVTDRRLGAVVKVENKKVSVKKEALLDFKLKVSELRLAGLSEEEILNLVSKYYKEI